MPSRPTFGSSGLLRALRFPLVRRPTSLASRPSRLASTAPTAPNPSRLTPYIAHLRAQYPHAEPRSLVAAFVVLHELTALVPLAILFGAFHYLGAGAALVVWVVDETTATTSAAGGGETTSTWKDTIRTWLVEAENKAERVGRRYGLFGWTKESREEREERKLQEAERPVEPLTKERLLVSGDVANAAAAYLAVKVRATVDYV